jgi:predicted O-methyltransferase YrrM
MEVNAKMNINGSRIVQSMRLQLFGGAATNPIKKTDLRDSFDGKLLSSHDSEWHQFCRVFEAQTSTLVGEGGVNIGDMRALFSITRSLQPKRILEVGTHLGFSTSVFAAALEAGGSRDSIITTVDIADVNSRETQPWRKSGSMVSPYELCKHVAPSITVRFEVDDSVSFMSKAEDKFDLVFLDGSHDADAVFNELNSLHAILAADSTVLLHDYFPGGRPLWSNNHVIYGPYLAAKKFFLKSPSGVTISSLSPLPWETKLNSRNTSLAYLHHG